MNRQKKGEIALNNEQFLADMHMHSDSSPDGRDPTTSLCEVAVAKGLSAVAITDHCEMNVFFEESYNRSIKQSMFEIAKARVVFSGRIRTLIGVELGQATQNMELAKQVNGLPDLDFVIGSLHNTRGRPDFAFIDYTQENIDTLLTDYYTELLELAEWGGFDVMGHLTYPLRYIEGEHGIPVNLKKYRDIIDAILCTLIANDCGIEINTSTLRSPLGKTMPDFGLVRRYRELGGRILTVGSDAHCIADVGAGIQQALMLAREAGFTSYHIFEKRKPVEIPIL